MRNLERRRDLWGLSHVLEGWTPDGPVTEPLVFNMSGSEWWSPNGRPINLPKISAEEIRIRTGITGDEISNTMRRERDTKRQEQLLKDTNWLRKMDPKDLTFQKAKLQVSKETAMDQAVGSSDVPLNPTDVRDAYGQLKQEATKAQAGAGTLPPLTSSTGSGLRILRGGTVGGRPMEDAGSLPRIKERSRTVGPKVVEKKDSFWRTPTGQVVLKIGAVVGLTTAVAGGGAVVNSAVNTGGNPDGGDTPSGESVGGKPPEDTQRPTGNAEGSDAGSVRLPSSTPNSSPVPATEELVETPIPIEPTKTATVEPTVDAEKQILAEYGPKRAGLVVTDPDTGKVIFIVNADDYSGEDEIHTISEKGKVVDYLNGFTAEVHDMTMESIKLHKELYPDFGHDDKMWVEEDGKSYSFVTDDGEQHVVEIDKPMIYKFTEKVQQLPNGEVRSKTNTSSVNYSSIEGSLIVINQQIPNYGTVYDDLGGSLLFLTRVQQVTGAEKWAHTGGVTRLTQGYIDNWETRLRAIGRNSTLLAESLGER